MSEKVFRKQVIEFLEDKGCIVLYIPNEALRSVFNQRGLKKGFPDLTVIVPHGKVFFLELKSGNNKPTMAQIDMLSLLRSFGFVAEVVRSLDEVRKVLKEVTDGK